MSDRVQWVIVGAIIIAAILWVIRRSRHSGSCCESNDNNCDNGCVNCPVAEHCRKAKRS